MSIDASNLDAPSTGFFSCCIRDARFGFARIPTFIFISICKSEFIFITQDMIVKNWTMTKKVYHILIFEQIFMGHAVISETVFEISTISQRKPS